MKGKFSAAAVARSFIRLTALGCSLSPHDRPATREKHIRTGFSVSFNFFALYFCFVYFHAFLTCNEKDELPLAPLRSASAASFCLLANDSSRSTMQQPLGLCHKHSRALTRSTRTEKCVRECLFRSECLLFLPPFSPSSRSEYDLLGFKSSAIVSMRTIFRLANATRVRESLLLPCRPSFHSGRAALVQIKSRDARVSGIRSSFSARF